MGIFRKLLLLGLLAGATCRGEAQRLLSSAVAGEDLKEILIPRDSYHPVPGIGNRELWENLPEEISEPILSMAEGLLDYQWPSISATTTLLFVRSGDREEYQGLSFQKRRNLETLVFAELIENRGRFLDQVINGIWSICEESYWGVPAHLQLSLAGSGLPDVSEPWVDLFAAETASYLAWADYFLGEKLDKVSPQIRKRIKWECDQRIFNAILDRPHDWREWTFNWNPWICSNWLNAVLLLENDNELRARHVGMVLEAQDNFLDPYPSDGGCDEGPGYWNAAGSSLFECLELLNLASGGKYQVFNHPKIRNIGSYIYKVQISRNSFINFADADGTMQPGGHWIYRFGKRIEDASMVNFAANYLEWSELTGGTFHMTRRALLISEGDYPVLSEEGLPLPENVWFPEIEWMLSRDRAGTDRGICLAAKGGNNAEAHNHNDVGSFMLYGDGLPFLIDVGRGTYTARFFGPDRYQLWMTNSAHHNLPLINGFQQPAGGSYRAKEVNYTAHEKRTSLSMELKEAYPEEAGIIRWNRTITHRKNRDVTVVEEFELENPGTVSEVLMTSIQPDVSKPGLVKLNSGGTGKEMRILEISYNQQVLSASVTKMSMNEPEDQNVISHWGPDIYRLEINSNSEIIKGEIELHFRLL